MKETIIAGDDDDDLCGKKKVSKKHFVLTSLVAVAFMTVIVQQWQGLLQWESPVAIAAGNSSIENVCAFKENFTKSLLDDGMQISFVKDDACVVKQEEKKNTDANVTVDTDVDADVTQLEQEITALVSAYPIVAMAPAIARQDRIVAAFLVSIAKKESDWGKHSPTKNGSDCYNYWGYKGGGVRGNAGGYACFASREEAVQTVGNRLFTLAQTQHRDTPAKMLVWKCGNSCAGHTPEGVASWIGSVDMYFQKIVTNHRG